MLTVVPPAATLAALDMVSAFAGTRRATETRSAFLTAIAQLQGIPFAWSAADPNPQLVFAGEDELATAAIRHIVANKAANVESYAAEEMLAVRANVRRGLNRLRALDEETYVAAVSLLGSIALGKLPALEGGSTSSLIGVIWIGLDADADSECYAELILHEYIHQTLFVEDMVNGVFFLGEEELACADALVTTAILQRPRGYDKGFHSAFVALSLARLARLRGDRLQYERYLTPLVPAARELFAKRQFLSARGDDLLELLGAALTEELAAVR